jgi:hypothetical protein
MLKNNTKKLSLNTETLVRLTPEHLEGVVGGLGDIKTHFATCIFRSCDNRPQPVPVPTPGK